MKGKTLERLVTGFSIAGSIVGFIGGLYIYMASMQEKITGTLPWETKEVIKRLEENHPAKLLFKEQIIYYAYDVVPPNKKADGVVDEIEIKTFRGLGAFPYTTEVDKIYLKKDQEFNKLLDYINKNTN